MAQPARHHHEEHVSERSEQKTRLQVAYKEQRDQFDKFVDRFHKAERARTKESKLSAWQQSKFVPWDTIAAEVKGNVQYLDFALNNTDGMFTNDDLMEIQRAVQAVLYVLLPPQRGGTYVTCASSLHALRKPSRS